MSDEGAQIAGHPLVRALRRDAEREVWVASDGPGGDAEGVELHRSLPGAESVLAREVEALVAAGHPHVVPILDLATDGGAVLVRPLLPMSLADWLIQRQAPAAGEAVTALAPIAAALGSLHAVGASAGGCSAADVRLDGDGAPMLLGEGARIETTRPTQAWLESSDGVASDVDGWRRLARAMLEMSGCALPAEVEAALVARDMAGAGAALLAAWSALPLTLAPSSSAEPWGSASARRAAQPRQAVRMRDRGRGGAVDALLSRLALAAERLVERGGPRASRIAEGARAVRPRFWVVAAIGAVASVVAAMLLWPTASDESSPSAASPAASPTGGPEVIAAERPAPEATPVSDAAGSQPAAADLVPPVDANPEAAVAAVSTLLAERESCLAAGDAACLVALHEPGSPQLTTAEPWRMPDDGTLELVQRLGDAWLLRVVSERKPASVLAMSTEAGWTLRDAWAD
ncbi:hypothetical protein [Agrococcus sp. Marseille-P2731]|uniref:hypothetical protein n=1 Tax=Agrococcus sp. Marseille-P2731 TaxID=1841862 RepID=UPI0011603B36|nr:hypothetical protein [Agrococcus sp. Marseille-P2731]